MTVEILAFLPGSHDLVELEKRIASLAAQVDGRFGVCVRNLRTNEEIGVRLDEPLPMASTCKVPILVEAYLRHEAGELDLAERAEFTEETRCFGSGLFSAFDPGVQPTVHDLLLMMIVVSDNAATDLVLNRLTAERVTATMRKLDLTSIRVDRTIRQLLADYFVSLDPRLETMKYGEWDELCEKYPDIKAKSQDLNEARRAVNQATEGRDQSSPRDMARLCGMIAKRECAKPENCEAMLDIMDYQLLNARLPRDFPPFARFPHKTGTLGSGAVVNDAGVLFIEDEPAVSIAVLSADVRNPIHETCGIMAAIGRAVHDHFNA